MQVKVAIASLWPTQGAIALDANIVYIIPCIYSDCYMPLTLLHDHGEYCHFLH